METLRMKTCTGCGETKGLDEFHKHSTGKHGVRGDCKACCKATDAAWQAANRERKRTTMAAWRAANPEYERERRRTDPQFRIARLLRNRLKNALRNKAKTGSAVQDLGMPVDAFLVYLNLDALDKYGIPYTGNEKLFHIDHIRPLVSFNLEDPEQLRIAVRWDNLQVLRAQENLTKGANFA